jgi:ParB family chromosome partitioning protein
MEQAQATLMHLPLGNIRAGRNPRTYFDPQEMAELVESIRANGVAQPILVRSVGDEQYEIIAGERRVRAAKTVFGDEGSIPAMVRECDDAEAECLALVENTDRADMSATEEAQAAHRVLMRLKGDRLEAAGMLGWPLSKLDRRLALMNLTEEVRLALTNRTIKLGHAELLAAVPPEKQNGALAKVIEHDLTIAQVKAQVATLANDLAAAVFDKTECADCRFNSAQQRALFGEAVADGSCTNGVCFTAKTDAHLEGLRTSLLDEVPKVIILRLDSGIEPIRLAAEGKFGVGVEQAKACRSCENFGCTVSGVVGSVGAVEKNLCFSAECHTTKVAANMKAMSEAAAAAQAERTASEGGGAAGEAASGGAAKKATNATNAPKGSKGAKAKAGPKPSVGVPQKVKDYRVATWRLMAAKEIFNNPDQAMVVLVTLGLSGNSRNIDDGKLKEVLSALTKTERIPVLHPLDSIASAVQAHGPLMVQRMAHAMAASAMKGIDEKYLRQTLSFLGVKVASHWKLCAELLDLMTKSEIETLAEEVGIAGALGEKEMKKVMAEKKPDAIKKLLAVPGFSYEGVVPQVMQYQEGVVAAADDGGDESDRGEQADERVGDGIEQGAEASADQQQVAEAA